MNLFLTLIMIVAVLAALALVAHIMRPETRSRLYGCNIAEGVHENAVTRVADAAITVRHLLYKKGAADNSVAVSGAGDRPLGTVDDEITTADIAGGVQIGVQLLGKGATKRMVASAAIGAGVEVFAAASGKIATSGTVNVGTSLTAAAADGDIIEVSDCVPA